MPKNIQRRHIERALREIDQNGVPPRREAQAYVVLVDGKRYPPKYVLGLANSYVNGRALAPQDHSGGAETNSLLGSLGFHVEPITTLKVRSGNTAHKTVLRTVVRPRTRVCTIVTVVIRSDGSYSECARLGALRDVLIGAAARIPERALLLFPGGWFKAGARPAGRLLSRVEPVVSGILRDVAEARFSVSMGIDGRCGPQGTLDQLAAVMTTDGTVAMARKFHAAPGETIDPADPWDQGEGGFPRVAEIDGRRYFLAVCYDSFGIKHGHHLKTPKVDAILDHVHGFRPKGSGDSGDVLFARHGFAGAAQAWGVPVFGAAVFFERRVPRNWPSGVRWKGPRGSTTEWTYEDNALSPKDVFSLSIPEGTAELRVFDW